MTAQTVKWTDQLANELHKPVVRKFRKRRVIVYGIDEIWGADLVDMQAFAKDNDGFRFLLSVIDVYSKYGWLVPIKDKSGKSVADAFEKIYSGGRKPRKLWVDKGKEFYNKQVKSLGVELYSTENEEKSCIVERYNRTMKEKMYKYFTANNTRRYVDVLDSMVKIYNNTIHHSTKVTPVEASLKKNEGIVMFNLYGKEMLSSAATAAKFKVGDKVRITVKKGVFEKGFTPRWTEEVFTISKVQNTDPPTYKIKDCAGEEIIGTFYESELQVTNQEVFRIEKIIKRQGNRSLVHWKGYPDAYNSWVDNKDLVPLNNSS